MTQQDKRYFSQLSNVLKAFKLLLYNIAPGLVTEQKCSHHATSRNIPFDLYEPTSPPYATYILVYGFTLSGETDSRLVRFGRACSASGLRIAIPVLNGLKTFRLDEVDIEAIVDLISFCHSTYQGSIGVIGFSAGGSLGLHAATDPRIAEWVDPIILFSPFYTLTDLYEIYKNNPAKLPDTNSDWDHLIWRKLVLAYRNIDSIGLTPAEKQELVNLLAEYCVTELARKKDFYTRIIQPHQIPGLGEMKITDEMLDRFSLCSKLSSLKGRVIIFHDPDDYLVPVEHSTHILQELSQRDTNPSTAYAQERNSGNNQDFRPGDRQKLLVTPLISHVTPRYALRLRESLEALRMLGELFVR